MPFLNKNVFQYLYIINPGSIWPKYYRTIFVSQLVLGKRMWQLLLGTEGSLEGGNYQQFLIAVEPLKINFLIFLKSLKYVFLKVVENNVPLEFWLSH